MATGNFSFDIKSIGKLLKAERLAVPPVAGGQFPRQVGGEKRVVLQQN